MTDRYRRPASCRKLEIWKPNRRVRSVKAGMTLRVQSPAAFRLHWSDDEWRTVHDTTSSRTPLQFEFVDIPAPGSQMAPIRFTFFWTASERWEGRDYEVAVAP